MNSKYASTKEISKEYQFNLCGYSNDLAEFLNRLAQEKKYQAKDLLVTSANHCTETTIQAQDNNTYVANLNDCNINVDARNNDVTIILPRFINYQASNLISIKKMDNTDHIVTIQADNIKITLKKANEQSQLQWTQPFFLHGQWQVTKSEP